MVFDKWAIGSMFKFHPCCYKDRFLKLQTWQPYNLIILTASITLFFKVNN